MRITLSEMSEQRKTNTICYYLHVKFLKTINKQKAKLIDTENRLVVARGEE